MLKIGIVIALACVIAGFLYFKASSTDEETIAHRTQVRSILMLYAAREIPAGSLITRGDIAIKETDQAQIPQGRL